MTNNEKIVFIGNRVYVYKVLEAHNCNIVARFAVRDSYLEHFFIDYGIEYKRLTNKENLISELEQLDYDILVSNGCPYILPITQLKKDSDRKFINVHPSLLPDLKGKNPINGALLLDRRHGVTCHYMDDGIDTGIIISQIEIPITEDIDIRLLYQLSFRAEGDVFANALEKNFEPTDVLVNTVDEPVYFSTKEADRTITIDDTTCIALKKIRAFAINGKYAQFCDGKHMHYIKSARQINNDYVYRKYKSSKSNTVICNLLDNFYLVKFADGFLAEIELAEDIDILSENSVFIACLDKTESKKCN